MVYVDEAVVLDLIYSSARFLAMNIGKRRYIAKSQTKAVDTCGIWMF